MADKKDEYIAHYGTPRHSGRYPWGSGKKYQRSRNFMSQYTELRKSGMGDAEIVKYLGMKNTSELRARKAMANEETQQANRAFAQKLKEKGMSNVAIAERMKCTEGTVRNYLRDNANEKSKKDSIVNVAKTLGDQVREKGFLDVGKSNNLYLGITQTKFQDALVLLQDQGYKVIYPRLQQMTTKHLTNNKVLIPPGKSKQEAYEEIRNDPSVISSLDEIHFTENGHGPAQIIHDPVSFDKSRMMIRYKEEGGEDRDGTIELRRGVKDLDMGNNAYTQVRILTDDGKLFMKGMAVYNDNMPDGVDVIFNSNKPKGTPLEKVLKEAKPDKHNPFGTEIKLQNDWTDENGKQHKGVLNILREEGDVDTWNKAVPSQFLGKQNLQMAKKQLQLAADRSDTEYEKIASLTNPTLKKKLLDDFADECDSAAVCLQAAAFPRQATKNILPVPSLKDNEVYAPGYENGEEVILVRFPHQGRFEIPVLKVNNNNKEAKKTITPTAIDAVGINKHVADRLSGADFDGDTVLIIPTKGQTFKTEKALTQLDGFDPKERYARPAGTKSAWAKGSPTEGRQMGMISNLITDMTLMDAPVEDIVRATKHALTIIDVAKHNLDYKESERENGIQALKDKYQGGGGVATLLSRAKNPVMVPAIDYNKPVVDPKTGVKSYRLMKDSERLWTDRETGEVHERMIQIPRMQQVIETTGNPRDLSSGLPMENVYADYAKHMIDLGRKARIVSASTKDIEYDAAAAKTYATEVAHLKEELKNFEKNQPLERHAQRFANNQFQLVKQQNPDMTKKEEGKIRNQLLKEARARTGAKRYEIEINDREWEAIQSGAINKTTLKKLLQSVDNDKIIERALPKESKKLSASVITRARRMVQNDYTWAEIAKALGVSQSALIEQVGKKGDVSK